MAEVKKVDLVRAAQLEREPVANAALVVAASLEAILKMSDDVKGSLGAIDMQGSLLRLQNSIQRNKARMVRAINGVVDAVNSRNGEG